MSTEKETMKEGLSVVMAVHDQAQDVERNLRAFLSLQCDVPYEVIVVDDSSSDDTPNVLKRIRGEFPMLYNTFLPKSVVYNPSRLQLALTVGAKAAHYNRIVLADINRPPLSDEWLTGLYHNAESSESVVFVYSGRRVTDKISHRCLPSLEYAKPLILKAERRSGRGHRGRWLKKRRGLYDAVSVPYERVHDAIRLFDKIIGQHRLWWLRLKAKH